MKNLKKKLPIVLIAFSMAVAFTVKAASFSPVENSIPGYLQVNPLGTVCEVSIMCSEISGPLCLVGATQVWGKDFSGRCRVRLYRDPFQ